MVQYKDYLGHSVTLVLFGERFGDARVQLEKKGSLSMFYVMKTTRREKTYIIKLSVEILWKNLSKFREESVKDC